MTSSRKERLDKLLTDRGLCVSRAQAQALIMNGKVKVSGLLITKPGTQIPTDIFTRALEVSDLQPYVSRGGLKLEKALTVFGVKPSERICMDVGASTGGFTDCLLQRGACHVFAVDVGYGQLDWKLRNDSRVSVLEKTNIRELKPEQLVEVGVSPPNLGVVDTSFISLKKVLPPLASLLAEESEMIALLKPQFEHRDYIVDPSFKGIVRGVENHFAIIQGVLLDLVALLPEWRLVGLNFSPITGPKGNIEYLLYFSRGGWPSVSLEPLPEDTESLSFYIRALIDKSYKMHTLS